MPIISSIGFFWFWLIWCCVCMDRCSYCVFRTYLLMTDFKYKEPILLSALMSASDKDTGIAIMHLPYVELVHMFYTRKYVQGR
jgi:hypothetical protein